MSFESPNPEEANKRTDISEIFAGQNDPKNIFKIFEGDNDPNLLMQAIMQAEREGRVNPDGSIKMDVSGRKELTADQKDAAVRRRSELKRRIESGSPEAKKKAEKELTLINSVYGDDGDWLK